jgi:hypothetical protein
MNRKAPVYCFLALTFAALSGCSSSPTAGNSKKAEVPLDRIQGKAQTLIESGGAADAALNFGGENSVYIREGTRRYRLFLRAAADVTHGNEYVVEGVDAQKAIEAIGDPDQGKNGYPLQSSCERVVKMAWDNLAFDAAEVQASVLRARMSRYPARPVFLVTRIRQATPEEVTAAAENAKKAGAVEEKNVPEVNVAAAKQSALLVEGSPVQQAPLFEPAGGTASCKVIIGTDGKISELETGAQLCEAVKWDQFRYKPTVQGGRPVKVSTEVEVKFEPRK